MRLDSSLETWDQTLIVCSLQEKMLPIGITREDVLPLAIDSERWFDGPFTGRGAAALNPMWADLGFAAHLWLFAGVSNLI